MKVIFSGRIPKEPAFPNDVEDMLGIADDNSKVVISDGASESFDSKTWAWLLTSRFIKQPELSKDWLDYMIAEYTACFDLANLSWSKQAAFARGSFATLLAVDQTTGADTIRVISVGDSLAVLLDGQELLESFPYVRAEDFQQRPELVSTNALSNAFIRAGDFLTQYQKIWSLQGKTNPILLCMTDALGEWSLRHWQQGDPRWWQLAQIRDVTELENLVTQEREEKALRVDDTTLVTLSFLESEKDELPDA
jgi:hypothetical protein